jgi:hypothetical protein
VHGPASWPAAAQRVARLSLARSGSSMAARMPRGARVVGRVGAREDKARTPTPAPRIGRVCDHGLQVLRHAPPPRRFLAAKTEAPRDYAFRSYSSHQGMRTFRCSFRLISIAAPFVNTMHIGAFTLQVGRVVDL